MGSRRRAKRQAAQQQAAKYRARRILAMELSLQRANERLSAQLQLYELTEAMARLGHWVYYPGDPKPHWSRGLHQMVGMGSRKMEGASMSLDHLHPQDREAFQRAMQAMDGQEFEYRARNASGVYGWFRTRVKGNFEAGQLTSRIGVIQNITTERAAIDALQQQLAFIQQITRNVPSMVCQLELRPDGSLFFPFASEAVEQIFRVSAQRLRESAEPVLSAIHADDLPAVRATLRASADTLTPWNCEFRVAFDDASLRWLLADAVPQREANGSVVWFGAVTDITAQKDAAMRLQESEARLRALSELLREKKDAAEAASLEKQRFLAAASHDLRQPAHAMGLFVAALAQRPLDPSTRQMVSGLEASVAAMQDMLTALFDISRLEAQAVQVRLVACPLEAVFEQLRQGFASAAAGKGLRLRVRPSTAWVQSDPVLLHRVLQNLVDNALRYTRSGAVMVAARVAAGGHELRIQVRDSGIGIAPQHHREIFSEFFQIGNLERDRAKGLGLGLSIVERTCRLLHHPVSLRSALGRGACFTLRAPLARPQAQAPAVPALELPAADEFAGLRLLVVEDDALGSTALVSLLRSWGFAVNLADGMAQASQMLRDGDTPDVIVSDYRLRHSQTGIEAIQALRRQAGRLLPACLISGDTDAELNRRAAEAGLTLLYKPVAPAKLRKLLRHLTKTPA
jgi:signal transduction histidine kinase